MTRVCFRAADVLIMDELKSECLMLLNAAQISPDAALALMKLAGKSTNALGCSIASHCLTCRTKACSDILLACETFQQAELDCFAATTAAIVCKSVV